ncbi:hypothetical protein Dimus_020974, partial [Dionaea muscipula]
MKADAKLTFTMSIHGQGAELMAKRSSSWKRLTGRAPHLSAMAELTTGRLRSLSS